MHHTGMRGMAQPGGAVRQRPGDGKIGGGREFHRQIFAGGALLPDGGGGDHQIAPHHLVRHPAAGSHPDEGMGPAFDQLLHTDGGGWAADPMGDHQHPTAGQVPRPRGVLPVAGHRLGAVQPAGDALHPARIPGQQDIARSLLRMQADMVHLFAVEIHQGCPLPSYRINRATDSIALRCLGRGASSAG